MKLDPQKPSTIWQAVLPWFAKTDRWRLPIGELGDQLLQAAVDALRLRYPELTPDDRSLTLLGLDRRIPRAPNETAEAYTRRLILWLDLWAMAGTPAGLLYALQSFIFPGYPTIRMVDRNSLWCQLDEGASRDLTIWEAVSVPSAIDGLRYIPPIGAAQSPRAKFWWHQGAGWDWDSISNPERAAMVQDYWIEVAQPSYPFVGKYAGTGDNAMTWGMGRAWGLGEIAGTFKTFRELVRMYQRAGSECQGVIFTTAASSFDPTATPDASYPDGTWSADSKIIAGTATQTRNRNYRYALPPF